VMAWIARKRLERRFRFREAGSGLRPDQHFLAETRVNEKGPAWNVGPKSRRDDKVLFSHSVVDAVQDLRSTRYIER
jgi:hypothetical protein